MRKLDTNKQIALGGMIIALNLLALYAAATLPAPRIALYFLSSLPVYILACEGAYLSAVVTYVATSALSFFLLPNPFALIPYALLLGHTRTDFPLMQYSQTVTAQHN